MFPCVWHSRSAFVCWFVAARWFDGVPEPAHLGARRGLHAAVAQVSSPCQTTRAASAPVIRRRRPDGRHAQRRVADAAPLLDYCGFVGGDSGPRRHPQAPAEPPRRSAGDHPRRPPPPPLPPFPPFLRPALPTRPPP